MWNNDNMTVTVNVQLFNNAFPDNHNRIGKYTDLSEQNDYFDELTKIEIDGLYNKIGEPILIVGDYVDYCGYNYGRFQYHNVWFYFSVVDYIVINESKVSLIYSLDYYETGRYQYNVSLGKGTIRNITTEYLDGSIARIPKSENGLGVRETGTLSTSKVDTFGGFIFYIFHSNDHAEINGIYVLDFVNNPRSGFIHQTLSNQFINWLTTYFISLNPDTVFSLNDIRGCWLAPTQFINYIKTTDVSQWECVDSSTGGLVNLYKNAGYSADPLSDFSYTQYATLKRTDTHYSMFIDTDLNVLWDAPTGDYFDRNFTLTYTIDISASSCDLKIDIKYNNYAPDRLVYPLPSVTIYNDTYIEYSARQRQTDIQLRHTTNEQQLTNGLVNIGSSIFGGAMASGVSGGGAGIGASAGFISGYVSSVGGYYLNEYYGNKQQAIIDNQYKRGFNNLLLHGDGILSKLTRTFGFVTVSYSGPLGADRTQKITDTYGWEINLHYPNVQTYIDYLQTVNENSYIMGNFEVNGNIPDNWKQQIKERFNGGVTFGI